ncbi:glycoside hydrolase family 3 N-terminal domain-containing protein [Fluviicola sp.]|uniref:glycoside hydrolase family 3 protein n=1 Tax=Fluviicola sp. TaxID=1917219 RepID=UPI0031E2CB92
MKCLLIFLLLVPFANSFGQLYKDSTQTIETRVNDLLSRMTPEEKFWQVFMVPSNGDTTEGKLHHGIFGLQLSASSQGDAGGQLLAYNTTENAIMLVQKINSTQRYLVEKTRLGIPMIPFDEALHGLVRNDAASFPQAIAMAATWDTTLIKQAAGHIAEECKIRGIRQILSPVINLATDVRWGRTEETYGEDPFLTTQMGLAFIRAFESRGIITTPKHFIANVGDGGRDSYPVHLSERFLEETHFVPFKQTIQSANARSIMTAYNSLNGTACSSNKWLLTDKLKNEWKFKGFVISDANAVGGELVLHKTAKDYAESGAHAINAGMDVIFQTDIGHASLFYPAFKNGLVDTNRLNDAVSRVLRAKFELGLFEHPYVTEEIDEATLHQNGTALTRQVAKESIVLLKNEKQTLPLSRSIQRIAVFGADATEARLGGYSGPGYRKASILGELAEHVDKKTEILYAEGASRIDHSYEVIAPSYLESNGSAGLSAGYFDNPTLSGQPVYERKDETIDFHWTLYAPNEKLQPDHYSARWTGALTAPESGEFLIGLEGNDGFRLYLDDKLLIDRWNKESYHRDLVSYPFRKGQKYALRVEFRETQGEGKIKLLWNGTVKTDWKKEIAKSVKIAQKSDLAIVVAGITEGEFQDRASLKLPGHQEELIQALNKTGTPVVVLIVGGSAVTMENWIGETEAVAMLWYPGQEGGRAVSDFLLGELNPGGKLPLTFPMNEAQLPLVYNHQPTGRGNDYNNLSGQPLFPFGFGLSYTQFTYSDIRLEHSILSKTEKTRVHFKLKNTGTYDGDEVVQLYIKDILSSVIRPVQELKGFQRIHLKAGEEKEITFELTPDLLEQLDNELKPVVEPGEFRIMIGSSSRDLPLKATLTIQ